MLTIFSTPKPFKGHDGIIQKNAIRSWENLSTPCQIILIGSDCGVAEMAEEVGCLHLPDVDLTSLGTPYLDGVFNLAQDHAKFDMMCYLNADVIIFDDLLEAAMTVRDTQVSFLTVGRRTDLDIVDLIDFTTDWRESLGALAINNGSVHQHTGMDYFIFPRGQIRNLPHFAVGRPAWDSWMIYNALKSGFTLIDATQSALVIHQNHGYEHVPLSRDHTWEGPEGDENFKIVSTIPGFYPLYYTIARAPWLLKDGILCHNNSLSGLLWRFKAYMFTLPIIGRTLRRAYGALVRLAQMCGFCRDN